MRVAAGGRSVAVPGTSRPWHGTASGTRHSVPGRTSTWTARSVPVQRHQDAVVTPGRPGRLVLGVCASAAGHPPPTTSRTAPQGRHVRSARSPHDGCDRRRRPVPAIRTTRGPAAGDRDDATLIPGTRRLRRAGGGCCAPGRGCRPTGCRRRAEMTTPSAASAEGAAQVVPGRGHRRLLRSQYWTHSMSPAARGAG